MKYFSFVVYSILYKFYKKHSDLNNYFDQAVFAFSMVIVFYINAVINIICVFSNIKMIDFNFWPRFFVMGFIVLIGFKLLYSKKEELIKFSDKTKINLLIYIIGLLYIFSSLIICMYSFYLLKSFSRTF